MTDFLSNLILRSTADPAGSALLQPRLPSLFEPLGGNEIPMPSPDTVVRETVAPTAEPSISASTINELPTNHPTITTEPADHERAVKPVQTRTLLISEQTARPPGTETQKEVVEPVQLDPRAPDSVAQFIFQQKAPQRTIVFHQEVRRVGEEFPAIDDYRSLPPKERRKRSPAEPLFLDSPKLETMPMPTPGIKDPLPAVITPLTLKEDSVSEDSTSSIVAPVSPNAESKPSIVLQPIPIAARPARLQQFESTQTQTPERVVEIHIGRIEVRATPPAPLKRTSQKMTSMSLEEYLRSRPGEKR